MWRDHGALRDFLHRRAVSPANMLSLLLEVAIPWFDRPEKLVAETEREISTIDWEKAVECSEWLIRKHVEITDFIVVPNAYGCRRYLDSERHAWDHIKSRGDAIHYEQ